MTNYTAQYTLTSEDGIETMTLQLGDTIPDFRGTDWEFRSITRGPQPGKAAKVLARDVDGQDREFYISVFPGLEVIEPPKKALNWRQIAGKSTTELDMIEDDDDYDEVTQELAHDELARREQEGFEASEHQAAYDDEWSRF